MPIRNPFGKLEEDESIFADNLPNYFYAKCNKHSNTTILKLILTKLKIK